ncbi:hypothetical protein BP6252_01924 [Coleophoma cylindrospora]|uniref:2EXR domain-containing protein n=1 Tax=Coleophoma cylindrospora TaxID=1849047 RepID=A0A3D8SE09_9HELO|nr:hypothetical protein BP6252_01924 [Coleophoma cylindrospora]
MSSKQQARSHNMTRLPNDINTPTEEDVGAFRLFSKLPAEVRMEIWKLSIEPRAVYHQTNRGVSRQPPSILSTCMESRIIGLKYYTYKPLPYIDSYRHIYFNYNHDMLVIKDDIDLHRIMENYHLMVDQKIHHVAIEMNQWRYILECDLDARQDICTRCYGIRLWPHLKSISLFEEKFDNAPSHTVGVVDKQQIPLYNEKDIEALEELDKKRRAKYPKWNMPTYHLLELHVSKKASLTEQENEDAIS